MKNILSFYGGHDASVTFVDKQDRVRVIEVERYVKQRYAAFSSYQNKRSFGISDAKRLDFLNYLYDSVFDPEKIDTILYMGLSEDDANLIKKFFPNAEFKHMNHHRSHAYCGHYQSGFEKSIIFSVDGGGVDHGQTVTTKVFLGNGNDIEELEDCKIDFGTAYMSVGKYISEIKKKQDDSLAWAGKIMGLCAYGEVREEWVEPMTRFYKTISEKTHENIASSDQSFGSEIIQELFPDTVLTQDCLKGKDSYDLAATSQHVFEELLFEWMEPYVNEYRRDVVLVGGCALNVLYNQRFSEYMFEKNMNKLYVPPNPNDCGLSLGFFLEECPELRGKDFVYEGIELLDRDDLQKHVSERNAKEVNTSDIVDIIKRGEIVGLVYGDSEIGPRALGNRSIICDPSFENMKDILNKKVKFREWYRPFAPVSMLHHSNTYFHKVFESNYMSFAPKVKEEYQEKLRAITHVDETSRLQTVCKVGGHRGFMDILEELNRREEIPVILNTSFNIRGYPILTTIEDALHVLDNTELDHVVVEGYLFSK